MILVPLWPKENNHLPLATFILMGINFLVFLIGGTGQERADSQVQNRDLIVISRRMAAILQDQESGISEAERTVLNQEISIQPFPSENLKLLFRNVHSNPQSLAPKIRYEWDLSFPLFEAYSSAGITPPQENARPTQWEFDPSQAWMPGLITHQFLHQDWSHFIFNMIFLWVAASMAEVVLGWHLLWVYILGGVVAAFAQIQAGIPPGQVLVGASGAISTLMGFGLLALPKAQVKLFYFVLIIVIPKYGFFDCPLWFFLPLWLLIQLLLSQLAGSAGHSMAFAAHIGGFLFGLLIGGVWKAFFPSKT